MQSAQCYRWCGKRFSICINLNYLCCALEVSQFKILGTMYLLILSNGFYYRDQFSTDRQQRDKWETHWRDRTKQNPDEGMYTYLQGSHLYLPHPLTVYKGYNRSGPRHKVHNGLMVWVFGLTIYLRNFSHSQHFACLPLPSAKLGINNCEPTCLTRPFKHWFSNQAVTHIVDILFEIFRLLS